MANEATVQSSLSIRSGNLVYSSEPRSFRADAANPGGQSPGAFLAGTAGTDVDLSNVPSLGGLCRIQNLDEVNYVEYGAQADGLFVPFGEALPGESYVLRLSRFLGAEFGTGTGTAEAGAGATFRVKARNAPCMVLVEAFGA